jgi:hypothetical protein
MQVRIQKNASSEDIRSALSGFGRFSSIEIGEEKDLESKESFLIFREIGFFEGLHRLVFESKKSLEINRKNSHDYLYNFSQERPEIKKLLGSSILKKEYWTVGEFREKLKIKTDFVRSKKNNDPVDIPLASNSKVGVIDTRISKIKADRVVSWQIADVDVSKVTGAYDVKSENGDSKKIISVVHKNHPNADQLRSAYKSALSGAVGQVVISPIVDLPVDQIQIRQPEYAMSNRFYDVCSDESIRILLEEIDLAILASRDIESVTIARNGAPDERFLPRVVGQRAVLDEEKRRAVENQSKNLTRMPDSLKLIKGEMEERLQVKMPELKDVELQETALPGVSICFAQPEMLGADVAFLDFSSIERGAAELNKSGLKQLQRVWNLSRETRFATNREVEVIVTETKNQWNIEAFELPACELPANQVFAMQNVLSKTEGSDKEKDFFMNHLKNLKGQVVIEVRSKSAMRAGLLEALEELNKRPQGLGFDCVLAFRKHEDSWSLPKSFVDPKK